MRHLKGTTLDSRRNEPPTLEQRAALKEYLNGEPLFTISIIQQLEKLSHHLRQGKIAPGVEYTVPDIFGNTLNMIAPLLSEGQSYVVEMNSYREFAKLFDNEGKRKDQGSEYVGKVMNEHKAFYYLEASGPQSWWTHDKVTDHNKVWSHHLAKWNTGEATTRFNVQYWSQNFSAWDKGDREAKRNIEEKLWTDSRLNEEIYNARKWKIQHDNLISIVQKHKHKLANIDKIVCFALGSLSCSRPSSFIQHAAADTIRQELQKMQGGKNIQVVAQDPRYEESCQQILRERLNNCSTVSNDGFSEITANTLVISISPSVPICQIVLDITREFGGPLAFLCNKFTDDSIASEMMTESMDLCRQICHREEISDAKDHPEKVWNRIFDDLEFYFKK